MAYDLGDFHCCKSKKDSDISRPKDLEREDKKGFARHRLVVHTTFTHTLEMHGEKQAKVKPEIVLSSMYRNFNLQTVHKRFFYKEQFQWLEQLHCRINVKDHLVC